MENSQKTEAILLNSGLSSQNKIDQLSNFSDKVLSTISLYAIIFNHIENVKYLLEIGMSLEKSNKNGLCAVHLAAKNGSLDVLKYLWQEKQVDLTKVCNVEDNAQSIDYAVIHGHLSVVEWLSEQGVNINTLLSSGEHLIHLAAYNNHLNIIKWLVQKRVPHDLANSQQK